LLDLSLWTPGCPPAKKRCRMASWHGAPLVAPTTNAVLIEWKESMMENCPWTI